MEVHVGYKVLHNNYNNIAWVIEGARGEDLNIFVLVAKYLGDACLHIRFSSYNHQLYIHFLDYLTIHGECACVCVCARVHVYASVCVDSWQ